MIRDSVVTRDSTRPGLPGGCQCPGTGLRLRVGPSEVKKATKVASEY